MDLGAARRYFSNQGSKGEIRYLIWQLVCHFEELDRLTTSMLDFHLTEEALKEIIELRFIEMDTLARKLYFFVDSIELEFTEEELNEFQKSSLFVAIEKMLHLLAPLKKFSHEKENWVILFVHDVSDQKLFKQLKALVFSGA